MLDLEAIKARATAATPGPWIPYPDPPSRHDMGIITRHDDASGFGRPVCQFRPGYVGSKVDFTEREYNNRVFIAHAREDVPALVEEIERLREQLCREMAEVERLRSENAMLLMGIVALQREAGRLGG